MTYRFCPCCGVKFTGPEDTPCNPYENWFPEGHDGPPRMKCLRCGENFPVDPPPKCPYCGGIHNPVCGCADRCTECDGPIYFDHFRKYIPENHERTCSRHPDFKPSRIAELREKWAGRPMQKDGQYEKSYRDATETINELLDMLEAKDAGHRRVVAEWCQMLANAERKIERLKRESSG